MKLSLYYDDEKDYFFIGNEQTTPMISIKFENDFKNLSNESKTTICKATFNSLEKTVENNYNIKYTVTFDDHPQELKFDNDFPGDDYDRVWHNTLNSYNDGY
jgi:hypothetical protein